MPLLRHFFLLALGVLLAPSLFAAEKFQGQCRTDTGVVANACTVTVYDQGTTDVSSIYSDYGLTTPKANPFTADSSGRFDFYGADARYDVVLSGGTPTLTTVTLGDVQLGTTVAGVISSLTLVMPGQFTVSGSPLTTAGTITVTQATQAANTFLAGPASGGAATPTFRQPGLGEFTGDSDDVGEGGTNLYFTNARARAAISAGDNMTYDSGTGIMSAVTSITAGAGAIPKGDASPGRLDISWLASGTPDGSKFVRDDRTLAQVAFSQLTGAATDAQVPDNITVTLAATATALAADPTDCSAGEYANAIDASGNLTCAAVSGGVVEADDLQVYDDTPITGATTVVVKSGVGQSTTDLMQWQDNAGTVLARVRSDGDLESPNVLTEDTDDRTTAFIGTDTAEAGTTTTNLTMTAHGLSTNQVICNETRSACSSVTVVDADNVTTSAITGQASGDAIRTYNYPNRRSSWYHETTPIDDIFLDEIPLGAVQMTWDAPPTRNFDSLIYLDLPAGAAIDKGRGLFVWNHGSSDGINVLADNGGVAAAFICGDASTPTNNSFCEAHEVRSQTSIGSYVRSTATAGGPHLMFLDQQSTAAAKPTAMIDITGNAAHTGFNVKNTGGNAGVIYYQALDSEGDVRFQMSGNGIELGDTGDDSAATTIDFHSGSATADYDARILATGGAGTNGTGTLAFYAGTVDMSGLTLKSDDLDLDDGGTKPTCDSSQRGKFWFEEGAGGVADTVEICGKDAADAYAWVAIATF